MKKLPRFFDDCYRLKCNFLGQKNEERSFCFIERRSFIENKSELCGPPRIKFELIAFENLGDKYEKYEKYED